MLLGPYARTIDGLTTLAPNKEAKPLWFCYQAWIRADQYLPCPYVSRAPIQILACGGRRNGTKRNETKRNEASWSRPTRVEYSCSYSTPRLLPGRAGESVKRWVSPFIVHPHLGRPPSHAHVACAVCPQLLSCPSTARYCTCHSPPLHVPVSRRPQPALPCPAPAHMHGVVSCTSCRGTVFDLLSKFETVNPRENRVLYFFLAKITSNRTTGH
jgi:hypothetical protein